MPRNSLTEDMKQRMLELMCSRLGVTVEDLRGGKVDWNRDKSKAVWTVAHEVVGFSEHQMNSALRSYMSPSSSSYRPALAARWKVVAPQWWSSADPEGKKAELLAMALRGEPRPASTGKNKHPLGAALCNYTNSNSKSYDPVFTAEIKALRPDWFVSRSDKVAQNKLELKAMALRGEPRPNQNKHPLGRSLCDYTNSNSKSYDPVFTAEIKALRPDWFVSRSEKADLNKAELKAMAIRGEPRPASYGKNKHPLGMMLCHYTDPGSKSYDPVFDQEIRALAPQWFTRSNKIRKARAKKKEQACTSGT
jgi:hypothetical protein